MSWQTFKSRTPGNRISLALLAALNFGGCAVQPPSATVVCTQTPVPTAAASSSATVLDERYPSGSRVVLISLAPKPSVIQVLSKGFMAAGDPLVAPKGDRILFVGKKSAASEWQIYVVPSRGGTVKALTTFPGGAMSPALLANGELVCATPVPVLEQSPKGRGRETIAALYAVSPGTPPRRLTFGVVPASDPTVLSDGRILFVAPRTGRTTAHHSTMGLFTINNDGTEFTSFALDQDGAPVVRRPRELPDGRIAFLSRATPDQQSPARLEFVRTARPFGSRAPLLPFAVGSCSSATADHNDALLVCLPAPGTHGQPAETSFAVYRLGLKAEAMGTPIFDDSHWNEIEATAVAPRPSPMGHPSSMSANKTSGILLCLDANFTRQARGAAAVTNQAERVRFWTLGAQGERQALGEVPVQRDGSFMAEVPADTPLGLETVDEAGRVLRQLPPAIWVRPGENRSCLGCHESPNRAPRNVRPLAVSQPPAMLAGQPRLSMRTTP